MRKVWALAAAVLFACCVFTSVGISQGSDSGPSSHERFSVGGFVGCLATNEDVPTLVGLKLERTGMAMSPYYSIRQLDDGFACAITSTEVYWPAIDAEEGHDFSEDYPFLSYDAEKGYAFDPDAWEGDPFAPDARFSCVLLDESDMADLQAILERDGVLAWDGFDGRQTPRPGFEPTDTGSTFELRLLFSDGSVLVARGVDAFPDGYGQAMNDVDEFFGTHSDYSGRHPVELPDAAAVSLLIEFSPEFPTPSDPDYKIELRDDWGRWIVVLRDPRGELLSAGTDVGEYGDVDDPLPIGRFLALLDEHGLAGWNGADERDDDGSREWCTIHVLFSNGQEYRVETNVFPEGYEEFRADAVREMAAFCEEVEE